MKILIIEDNQELLQTLSHSFVEDDMVCELCQTYDHALEKIMLYHYDIVILDINLPDGNGLNILKKLKSENTNTGTIIISARDSVQNKIEGLELGADDYLAKPFDVAELIARVKSLYRRQNFEGKKSITYSNITFNSQNGKIYIHDNELILTKSEYKILLFFFSNRNRVLTKETIAEHIMGDDMDLIDSFDFIYSHIKNLRKKIINTNIKDPIKVIYGIGYQFIET
ncbi:transcriptional regulatory protein [Flavobacteriaceae bacterium UJ101]|nr:transcriptional regulatory protein [Flavobacteriaceae bacterium UJ101]